MTLGVLALTIALVLLLAAVWVYLGGRWAADEAAMPAGELIYADIGEAHQEAELLRADQFGLIGKPDYLIRQQDGGIIPVELKSSAMPSVLYENHVMQLAAYCLLVEENYGIRPDYGIIQYQDGSIEVDFTYELEHELLQILDEMRADMLATNVDRSHDRPSVCAACRMRPYCDQRLL